MNEIEKERIDRIIDGGNRIEIALLKKEIEDKIDQAHNELSHYEFYLVQSDHLRNCSLCRAELDQVKEKKN